MWKKIGIGLGVIAGLYVIFLGVSIYIQAKKMVETTENVVTGAETIVEKVKEVTPDFDSAMDNVKEIAAPDELPEVNTGDLLEKAKPLANQWLKKAAEALEYDMESEDQ